MRGHTVYEQIEHDQPGTPARVHTFPHIEDLAALTASIAELKAQVDVVILSHHAGIHFVPAVIPDYQRAVGRAAIDAGADLVLGCHAHILKGMEFYRGKLMVHSLANFALDLWMTPEHAASRGFREIQALSPGWEPDFTSSYNFPPDSRMSIALEARLTPEGVAEVALVPVWIGPDAAPRFLGPDEPEFDQVLDYLRRITAMAGLSTVYAPEGDVLRPRPA